MSHSVPSDVSLHCLPITLLGVSRLQWDKVPASIYNYAGTVTLRELSIEIEKTSSAQGKPQ